MSIYSIFNFKPEKYLFFASYSVLQYLVFIVIKGTVVAISNELPIKEEHARFTKVPFRPVSKDGHRFF